MTAGWSLTARRGTRAVPYGEQDRRGRDDVAYGCADRRKDEIEGKSGSDDRRDIVMMNGVNPPDGRDLIDRFPLCTQVIGD